MSHKNHTTPAPPILVFEPVDVIANMAGSPPESISGGAAGKTADGAATDQPTSLQKDLPTEERIPTH
jgi:hypothetical protein